VAAPRTRSGRLSELARHVVLPSGIDSTGWPAVRDQCAEWGIDFDEWQDGLGRAVLGKRADGIYAATVGGIVLSIPRQVAKTFIVSRLLFALCVLFPGLRVLWTAHHNRTITNTFRSLQSFARRAKVAPHIAHNGIRTANGEQEIRFKNGSIIMFGAREQGFGRGFDEVDVEVFDEAQILTEKALEDMVAATNQARHPHGALLFYMGTPPRPTDPGEAFTLKRTKALSGKAEGMVFVEFSADRDASPDDREQWAKANPSFPHRTPLESMLRLRENLPSEEAWMREALGIWDSVASRRVIDAVTWNARLDEFSLPVERLAISVDVNPDNTRASVSMAGQRSDGDWHVELDEQRESVGWVVPWIKKRCENNDIRAVVIDGASPAAALIEPLAAEKITVTVMGARDMAQACGSFYVGAVEGWLHHIGQPQMNAALGEARKRPLVGAWGWDRAKSTSDITPVVAATAALWGARTAEVKKPFRNSKGRRVAVLA
jgi:phage terminase large subunit-like protein